MSAIVGKNYELPALDLNFAENKSLIDSVTGRNLITFSRSQSGKEATYVGSDGLIKYAGADEPRFDHDPETGEDLGLLIEEQRTNLLRYSDQLDNETVWTQSNTEVTANQAISPDGTQTADLVEQLIAGVNDGVYQLVTGLTATAQYTFSFWARSNSPITVKTRIWDGNNSVTCNLTSEWKRFYVTETIPTTNVYALVQALQPGEQFYVWGAQLERGSFATSYIPTDGTPGGIVRGADVASITGTNFSSWYNNSGGTFYADCNSVDGDNGVFSVGTSTSPNEGLSYDFSSFNSVPADVVLNGTFNPVGSPHKFAVTSQTGTISLYADGVLQDTDTATNAQRDGVILVIGNRCIFGGGIQSNRHLNGTISRLTYWPKRLPDLELQQLTK